MDLLHRNGISVDLATPTAAPPVWLSHEHPEVLPVMEDGEVFGFGNRLHFDPTSPHYREHAARITTELAQRYSSHPALAMWHISNEYGPIAYTASSAVAFRDWLRQRYGDLDALNDAWYTRFWGQCYTSWEQVNPPEVPRTWSNPTRRLDFHRFTSDALLACYRAERDIVRALPRRPAGAHQLHALLPARRLLGLGARAGRRGAGHLPRPRAGRRARGRRAQLRPDAQPARRAVAADGAGGRQRLAVAAEQRQAARDAAGGVVPGDRARRGQCAVLPVAGQPGRARAVPLGDAAALRGAGP